MDEKKLISDIIEKRKKLFTDLSNEIWDNPELRFKLTKAADLLIKAFTDEGFRVKRNISKMKDAFIAEFGEGKPIIGILGEYDALANLSQEADIDYRKEITPHGPGHGCGHQALGVAGLASSIAIKEIMEKYNLKGTIRYYGCPAEEGGAGKAYIARDGHFDSLDTIISWHPMEHTGIWHGSSLSNMHLFISFRGVSSHAAAAPEQGRSALDAAEIMNIGTNYLREHIIDEARIHYSYLDVGGSSPNVVQSSAMLLYVIRAPRTMQVIELYDRIKNIAKGSALITGTEEKIECDSFYAEIIINETLSEVMYKNMEYLGDITYTEDEIKYAENFYYSIDKKTRDYKKLEIQRIFSHLGRDRAKEISNLYVNGHLYPYELSERPLPLSTDVGDASFFAPTVQLVSTCFPAYTALHTWQCTAVGKSSIMHKGLLYAAKAMAITCLDLLKDTSIIDKAKKEFKERLDGRPYYNPMPRENIPM